MKKWKNEKINGKKNGRNPSLLSAIAGATVSYFVHAANFLRQPGRGHGPSTLALRASRRFVFRKLTERVIIVIVINVCRWGKRVCVINFVFELYPHAQLSVKLCLDAFFGRGYPHEKKHAV